MDTPFTELGVDVDTIEEVDCCFGTHVLPDNQLFVFAIVSMAFVVFIGGIEFFDGRQLEFVRDVRQYWFDFHRGHWAVEVEFFELGCGTRFASARS